MQAIKMFTIRTCPYCGQAEKWLEELIREKPDYLNLTIERIDEEQYPDIADEYDYYYVPTFYVGDEKLHEGAAVKDDIRRVLDAALTGQGGEAKVAAAIKSPELLQFEINGEVKYGADQEWFMTDWQRKAGCGPTNCSHVMWYLSRTRPQCRALCDFGAGADKGFLRLMEQVWKHVTPGRMGVNSSDIFTAGAVSFAGERGVKLAPRVLEVPRNRKSRPDSRRLIEFLAQSLGDDLPVALLNLSHGDEARLDNWHWVTVVSISGNEAEIYDNGERLEVNLKLWLETSAMGGCLIALYPEILKR